MEKKGLFKYINSIFSHVYVVTIPRASYRHESLVKNLEGLDYELFFGLDIKDTSIEELMASGVYSKELAIKNDRYSKPIPGGMLGCSISHSMVYKDMLTKQYPTSLILEDDVFVNENAMGSFMQALQELPRDWGLLYFDYNKNEKKPALGTLKQYIYHIYHILGSLKYSHRTISNLYAQKFSDNLLTAGHHDFTDAYAITLHAAAELLKLQTPVQRFPDHLLAHACTNKIINGYCLTKKLFSQTSQTTMTGDTLTTAISSST